ncbi:MAG: transposase [Nitrospirales bacterium]|nr:MAG: transposase [Nitrospirales bacterium]
MPEEYLHKDKEELVAENLRLKAELAELKRLIFGRKSERFVPDEIASEQLNLFVQHDHEGAEEKTVQQAVQAHSRTKARPKRLKLPEDLPVVEVRIEPHPDEVKGWVKIGEEITEELDYVPGYLRINRYIRPKYARPKGEQNSDTEGKNIFIAPLPSRVIDKGIPSAGLLTYILVSKFVDHLPYHRIIQIFKRAGMTIPASTVNGWVAKCIELLRVLYLWHKARIMECDYLMGDETKIRVLKSPNRTGKKTKAHQGYFWVYYDPGGKQTLFIYDPGRAGKYPREHLQNFKGHLQTDGYSVYDAFDQTEYITLVGCMAHIRRKFEHALGNDKQRATHVLTAMQALYAIERKAKEENYSYDQRLALRQQEAQPIMDKLKVWLLENRDQVLPKSSIGQAINYACNRWKYMERYLEDGKLEIDNNLVENAIRPVAIGRKNYLFAGSPKGAEWAAIIYSLVSSAANCGHNPSEYLKDILLRLPDQPLSYLDELLPPNWEPLKEGMAKGTLKSAP